MYGCPVWGDYRKTEEVCPGGTGTSAAGFYQLGMEVPLIDSEGTALEDPIERDGVHYVEFSTGIIIEQSGPHPAFQYIEIKNPDGETVTDGAGSTPWAVTYGAITSIDYPFSSDFTSAGFITETMEFYVGGTLMQVVNHFFVTTSGG